MKDLDVLLKSLTLQEKISLLAGHNFWATVPVAGKVPSAKLSDGPNGVRGGDFAGVTAAACFPSAVCLAATFDESLVHGIGVALAEEAHTKGVNCVLAPTTCIHRHVLGGRNFESFSEDPFLSGKLAAQIVNGLQENGVGATLKHYVANEQETDRMRIDTIVSDRALREIYLRSFEIAVKEASPWAVMSAYNSVNGQHCDSNAFLLQQVLRKEWNYDGLIMSDWGGTNSVELSLNNGLDLEMPGPAVFRQIPNVLRAIDQGLVSESTIDERAKRLLQFLDRVRAFDAQETPAKEQAVDKPEHRQLIRDTAARGIVLLKNENNALPLSSEKLQGKTVALIGLSKVKLAHGGGSAAVKSFPKVSPWQAFADALGSQTNLIYAKGAYIQRFLAPLTSDGPFGTLVGNDGNPGWTRALQDLHTNDKIGEIHGQDSPVLMPFDPTTYTRTVEFIGDFCPKSSGKYYIGVSGVGPTQLFVDNELVLQQTGATPDPMGFIFGVQQDVECTLDLVAGTHYSIRARTSPNLSLPGLEFLVGRSGLRLGLCPATERDAEFTAEAVTVAKQADIAIVFTGHESSWETEGQDQTSFHLPKNGSQDSLVAAVAASNSNTIVINSTGVPIAMPWLPDVQAVLQTWFGGQEMGNSIADIVLGKINPEGHLPTTFPRSIEDTPAYGNFPGTCGNHQPVVEYKEGVFVGYRHYDRLPRDKVNFPFGHGLSYTTFGFDDLNVTHVSDEILSVSVRVSNTGSVAGRALVQLYAGHSVHDPAHPGKTLIAFEKIALSVGESKEMKISVPMRTLAYFDEQGSQWLVRAGKYKVMVGESVASILLETTFCVSTEQKYMP